MPLVCLAFIVLIISLFWASVWVDFNRPGWGYFLGLLPVLFIWGGAMNYYSSCEPFPSSVMLNCEGVGIGMLFASSAAGIFWLVYTLLFVVLYIRHRRQESWA